MKKVSLCVLCDFFTQTGNVTQYVGLGSDYMSDNCRLHPLETTQHQYQALHPINIGLGPRENRENCLAIALWMALISIYTRQTIGYFPFPSPHTAYTLPLPKYTVVELHLGCYICTRPREYYDKFLYLCDATRRVQRFRDLGVKRDPRRRGLSRYTI